MKKILIVSQKQEFSKELVAKLRKQGSVSWKQCDTLSGSRLVSMLESGSWDILALSPDPLKGKIPEAFYTSLGAIKHICIPTKWHDWLDSKRLRNMGITVSIIPPAYWTNGIAEWALCMLTMLVRNMPQRMRSGFREPRPQLASELSGKTAGIIGLGSIGTRIAELLSGLGVNVLYWSPHTRNRKFSYVPLRTLLKQSDFVFPAYAINRKTLRFLDKAKIAMMRTGAYVVNIATEMAWDTEAAVAAVKRSKLAGIAYETPAQARFRGSPHNILAIPWRGRLTWYTKEARARNFALWYENIVSCLKGKPHNTIGS